MYDATCSVLQAPVLARDIMTTKLVTLRPGMDVFDAIDLLLENAISGAPVIDDDGNFVGVFTEKDCLSILVQSVYDLHPTTKIDAFIERHPHTVDEQTDLLTIAQIFLRNPFRRVPVLRDGKLVGIIARRDILRAAHDIMHDLMRNGATVSSSPHERNTLLYLSSLVERHEAPIA
ncbi:MAG: CBS domain-containing protein [Planctomycetes bacterium]|nr:CBS domain-containing protein [Planctomycetota bacterium]